ncbi:MAG: single-stranded DNA-binding protein [Succinivibrio sp.]|nr:single-stranded DNA-binding protein [Succinivibrio sp.]
MRGVNKVIIVGTVGREPEVRDTSAGQVANLSVVTNEYRGSSNSGQGEGGGYNNQNSQQDFAEWHRIVLWNRLAGVASQYVHTGTQVYIEGRLRTRNYVDKQGVKRYITEIHAFELQLLGGRSQNREASQAQNDEWGDSSFSGGGYGTPTNQGYGAPNAANYPNNGSGYGNRGYGAQSNQGYGAAPQNPAYGATPAAEPGYGAAPSATPGYGPQPQAPAYGSQPAAPAYGAPAAQPPGYGALNTAPAGAGSAPAEVVPGTSAPLKEPDIVNPGTADDDIPF